MMISKFVMWNLGASNVPPLELVGGGRGSDFMLWSYSCGGGNAGLSQFIISPHKRPELAKNQSEGGGVLIWC